MKNAVLKCNQLESGWYVAKSSSHETTGSSYHIFRVKDEMMPEVLSLCKQVNYREINSRNVKEKVDNPLDHRYLDKFCNRCEDKFKESL